MASRITHNERTMAEAGRRRREDLSETSSDDEDDQIKSRFEKIIKDLTLHKRSLEEIVRSHGEDLRQTYDDGDNFLHFLTIKKRKESNVEKLKPLVNHLIGLNLELMRKKGTNGKTPLQTAIKRGRAALIEIMCDALNSKGDVDSVLFHADTEGNNCLHEAMKGSRGSGSNIALSLVDRVNNGRKLCQVNQSGHNPLHIAVEYERCSPNQVKVVRKLVDTCDKALEANILETDPRKLSVYRHHEKTRLEYLERHRPRRNPNREPGMDISGQPHALIDQNLESNAAPQEPSNTLNLPSRLVQGKKVEMNTYAAELPLQGIRRVPTPTVQKVSTGVSDDKGRPSKDKKKSEEEDCFTEASASEIRDLLKLRFMMNPERDHEQIISFLYNSIQQKDFCFSLVDGPASLSKQILEENLKYVQFEDTLQHVELPHLEIEKPVVSSKFAPKMTVADGRGRQDYVTVFKWLRKKGVTRILNLSIDDRSEPSHSEEAIEKALQDIEVIQLWDWRKPDLSSETIFNAAKGVEEVNLYWNGNNAVLRSWSEPEGLNKLQNLAKVTVFYNPQEIETRARTKENLNAFSERLIQNRRRLRSEVMGKMIPLHQKLVPPEIRVAYTIDSDGRSRKANGSDDRLADLLEQPQDQHRWITCMEEYADFIQGVQLDDSGLQTIKPVKVALIDDGYDISEPGINDKVVAGRSFCQHKSGKNYASYFTTNFGHGTIMANQICRVCPKVQLHMFRLDEHLSEQGKRQITAKSAVQAVRAAIDMGVDIISMSWTIETTEENKDHIEQLKEVLRVAAGKNILLFCACPDQGADSTPTYPAASEMCSRIGAAKASGEANQWVRAACFDFLFPGDKVIRDREFDGQQSKCRLLTGSSVATALAAGLGALVLYCVRFAVQHAMINNTQGEHVTTADLDRLKTRQGMADAFQAIGTTSARYLEVWDVFGQAAKAGNSPHVEDKRKAIVRVAKRLTTTKKLDVSRR
ncbi:hypothetical protein IWZ00DRAFT_487058 [Phyllosticta capitalensis]